ncbi:hypothetical protein [Ferrimicrobium sp.]|uniref:hypothetical protein n=1 Tax=Ferrimicrobium sp. TaxID=2926050 RepID=UPI0026211676|nr:hypothetical protein [Ferrimicrobium sp.]
MATWLDRHDHALVERAIVSLRERETSRWEKALKHANGDPRFALWLSLVDDLIETYPALQHLSLSTSSPVTQLRESYLVGCSPLDAASLTPCAGELSGTNELTQPSLTLGR